MKLGDSLDKTRVAALQTLEDDGMPVFIATEESYDLRSKAIPDRAGISQAEIDALPLMLQSLKCNNQLKHGNPFCHQEKYSKEFCFPRAKMAPWHPGFKIHAMDGHALGLFLVDALISALEDLTNCQEKNLSTILSELQNEERLLLKQLWNATLPEDIMVTIFSPKEKENYPLDETLDLEAFCRGPSFYRTAMLPAQSRHLGYTTNSNKTGDISVLGSDTYETGIPSKEAEKAVGNGTLALVYETGDNQAPCNVILKPDYKDFFYMNNEWGECKLVIPNEKERKAYDYSPLKYKGLIVISFVKCAWGQCSKGELRPEDFEENQFSVTVNGKPVTDIVSMGLDLWILRGENGLYWDPRSDGTYGIGFSIQVEGHFGISSVILY